MALGLSILAVIISFLAIFVYQWVTLVPQLGIGFLYHIDKVRLGVAGLTLSLALLAVLLQPVTPQLVLLAIALVLTTLSGANHASRFLVPLDEPPHIPAGTVDLPPEAELIALESDDLAHGWPLQQLIPHHIVNDWVDGQPVMAAW